MKVLLKKKTTAPKGKTTLQPEKNRKRNDDDDGSDESDDFDDEFDDDDDDDESWVSDDDNEEGEKKESDESEEKEDHKDLDMTEYRKFLFEFFPSKYLKNKIEQGENEKQEQKQKQKPKQKQKEEPTKQQSKKNDNNEKKCQKATTKKKTQETTSSSELRKRQRDQNHNDDNDDDDEDDDFNEDEVEDDDNNKKKMKSKSLRDKNVNIVLNIGSPKRGSRWDQEDEEDDYDDDYDEDDDDEWSYEDGEETENEDEEVSSCNDSYLDTDTEDEMEAAGQEIVPEPPKNYSAEDSAEFMRILQSFQDQLGKKNPLIEDCLRVCEKQIVKEKKKAARKTEKQKAKNKRIFRRVLRSEKTQNDVDFFTKMEIEDQKRMIKQVRQINEFTRVEKPYRLALLESSIPVTFKAFAMKKINALRTLDPGSGEYYKVKNWVDTFMRIPFGKYRSLPLTIDDGVEKCHEFMAQAQNTLNDAVYGLNDAKMQIMQLLGQLLTNPASTGTAIAIHGPAGTGKTSLVKEGISKILDRPFAFIPLGGATDSSYLEGHGYTYEGSTWGKIVQILIDSKCMNPVIYFDELDKISDTPKGEEITGILTHLTDTTQNSQFHDKYFAEIDFDLSKCLFIFSYNDENKVNPILRDRMYRIQTKGYDRKQKTTISNNYLLPKIREQIRFSKEDVVIPDETLHYIIENHCNREDGVRSLKRCLEIVFSKLNLYRLMRAGSNLFEQEMSIKVTFPFTVTKDIVDKLIKTQRDDNVSMRSLYI